MSQEDGRSSQEKEKVCFSKAEMAGMWSSSTGKDKTSDR